MFRKSISTVQPCVYASSAGNVQQWPVSEALKATDKFTLLSLNFFLSFYHIILSFSLLYKGHCKCLASLVGPVHVLLAVMFLRNCFMNK